jgi:zinc protease
VESLESITLDDVKAFYASHFRRDNATVALGGGYDIALAQRFEASLAELAEGSPEPQPAPTPAAFEGRHVLLVDKADADASISFGFPIDVRRGERDFYALWIANSWLGEHRNSVSQLYQVIREARGMNYGDYSYIEAFPEGGQRNVPPQHIGRRQQIFEVWIRTLPDAEAHFALRAAMRELKLLVDEGMTEEEFELSREFLKKYVLHFAETTSERLGYRVDDIFYRVDGEGHLARFQTMLDQITRDEVNAALKKYLAYDDVKIAMVTGSAASLKEALAADSPSPKTYGSPKGDEIVAEDENIAGFPLEIAAENIRVVPVDEMFQRP